jgi:hypothetical protein
VLEALEEHLLGQFLDHPCFPQEAAVQKGKEGSLEPGHEMGEGLFSPGLQLGHPVFRGRFLLRCDIANCR